MKSTQILPFVQPTYNVEDSLKKMKSLATKIKALTAEYDMLKKESIEEYFANNESYKNAKGLELATYKSQIQNQFQQSRFKDANPELYSRFTEEKTIFKFLLK